MPGRSARRDTKRCLLCRPILLLVVTLSLAGWSFLACTAQPAAVVSPTSTPPATATPLPPTHTPTATVAPTPTSSPTPLPPAAAQSQVLTHITIVHSNDTWGYTLPCG